MTSLSVHTSSSPHRRPALAVILTVAAVVLAACTSTSPDQSPDPSTDDAAADPALASFYDQDLAWEDCGDYAVTDLDEETFPKVPTAECARLEVPMDYASPDNGQTSSVAVMRIPASGERIGSLMYNPGGPGGAGLLGAIGAWGGMEGTETVERFDIVGFDPRGVGATEPAVDCYSPSGDTAGDEAFARVGSIVPTLTEADTQALVERCAEGSGGMEALGSVGTRTTAADMDVLRAALGEDQLNFLGQSYGTRLGAVYAEEFPGNVRAMVLDGAFDPTLSRFDRMLASYTGFQAAFEAMAASCAEEADCPLGDDPDEWTATFQQIVQPLADDPVPAGDSELDFDLALSGVMAGLYSPEAWPDIIDGLREVENGRGDRLLGLIDELSGVSDEGEGANFQEAIIAINCVDEAVLPPGELTRLREETFADAPFMDSGRPADEQTRDHCADWPVTDQLGVPYAQDIDNLPETLVVSITGDPTTPHAGAVSLADTLGSTLLTVEGEGHTTVSMNLSDCVTGIAEDYLVRLDLPEEDPTCTLPEVPEEPEN